MSEFIEINYYELRENANKLLRSYQDIDKKLKSDIVKRVLEEAGKIFLEEQRRILRQRYPNSQIAPLLKVWTEPTRYGWQLRVGIPKTVTKEQAIRAYELEFGRPGKRSLKNGGRDAIGRKIGKVEPYSYIRASRFLKSDEVMRKAQELLDKELRENWNRGQ